MSNIKLGDILIFKGGGLVFTILGTILKWFEPWWDKFGWHLAFVSQVLSDGTVVVAEACAKGVHTINLALCQGEWRANRWFDVEPNHLQVIDFVNHHRGDHYDVLVYFWTFIQRVVLKIFKWQLPRLMNDNYTCFEWVEFFCTCFGKPWTKDAPLLYPLITDFLAQNPTQISP